MVALLTSPAKSPTRFRDRSSPFSPSLPRSPSTKKPHVTLKEHTRFPRMQERGLRFYEITLGRWMSRDPLGEQGGSSLYRFCLNTPTWRTDRLGLMISFSIYSDPEKGVKLEKDTGQEFPYQNNQQGFEKYANLQWGGNVTKALKYPGITWANILPKVEGEKDEEEPCCCNFSVKSITPEFDVYYMAGSFGQTHEYGHRQVDRELVKRYAESLTKRRTCCYAEGIWGYKTLIPQTPEDCKTKKKENLELALQWKFTLLAASINVIDQDAPKEEDQNKFPAALAKNLQLAKTVAIDDWEPKDILFSPPWGWLMKLTIWWTSPGWGL